MRVRPLYSQGFDYYNTIHLQVLANEIPYIHKFSQHIAGRFLILFFKTKFYTKKPDIDEMIKMEDRGLRWEPVDRRFEDAMKCESVAQYIILNAIYALHGLIERRYFAGMTDEEIYHYLRMRMSAPYRFIHEQCVLDVPKEESIIISELFAEYINWIDRNNIITKIQKQSTFTKALASFGIQRGQDHRWVGDKRKHVMVYLGVNVREKHVIEPEQSEINLNDIDDFFKGGNIFEE